MLLLDRVERQIEITHEGTGAKFALRPLEPRRHASLQNQCRDRRNPDIVDYVKLNGLIAKEIILEWEGVGDKNGAVECTDENKIKFGERYSGTVMPDLVDRATDVKLFQDEVDAAKKD